MLKKVLQFTFSLLVLLLFLVSPSSAFAATCDAVIGDLNISPETGSTNTTFVVSGKINDCANQDNVNNTLGELLLSGDTDAGANPPFSAGLTTDAEGNFREDVVVSEEGTWNFQVMYHGALIGGNNNRSLRVGEGTSYSCGDTVPQGTTSCPVGCEAQAVSGSSLWKCGGENPPSPTIANPDTPTPRLVAPPCVAKPDAEGKIKKCDRVRTSLGVEFETTPEKFVAFLFTFFLSLAGSILLAIIIYSGFQMMTSRGDQEKIKVARERITSAIVGFMFLIFSLVILEVIGVDILRIPGFCGSNDVECENISQPTPTSFPTPQTTPTTDTPNGRPR